ncbi:hypothetical protein [Bradyrhizobium cenepequi]
MFHIIMTDCVGHKLDERVVPDKEMIREALQSIVAVMNFGDGDSLRVVYRSELANPSK